MANKEIFLQLNPNISRQEWEDYVFNHPDGNVYHLPAWEEVLEESFNYKPFYLFAKNSQQKLCGILPLFQIKSILTGNRLIALPFSYICGPIADSSSIEQALFKKAKEMYLTLKADYLEIRTISSKAINWNVSNYFSTYRLKLSKDPQELFKKFHRESVRKAIHKAKKRGLIIIQDNSLKSLKIYYQLNLINKSDLGTPAHPFFFLEKISQKIPKYFRLYLAQIDHKYIAGLINFSYKKTVIAVYGASDKRYLKYNPNNLLIWQAIEDACREGYEIFDFGRTAQDNFNLINYKKRWGAEEQKLYYYYPQKITKLSHERRGFKYKALTNIWKKIPLTFSGKLSNFLYKHLD